MGKTIVADNSILNILTELSDKEGYTPGLIVGQPSDKKDFALHIIPTKPQNVPPDNFEDVEQIDESLLKNHMRNVTRSLSGGIYVIGLFIVGPKDIFNDKQGLKKIRSLISNLYTTSKSNIFLYGNVQPKIVLHFSSLTKKYQGKSFSMENMDMSMSPVSWKFYENPFSWYEIDCHYVMDSFLPCDSLSGNKPSTRKILKEILDDHKKSIDLCYCTINGYFEKNSNCNTLDDIRNLLINDMGFESKNVKDKELQEYEYLKKFNAMLFKMEAPGQKLFNFNDVECFDFEGVLSSKVFLHRSATLEEAISAVKEDLVRSWAARLELHYDYLGDTLSNEDPVLHTPPRRVLIKHIPTGIMFSDYMFVDDTEEDVATSFKDYLGIEVLPNSIIDWEPPADIAEEAPIETCQVDKTEISKPSIPINILLMGIVGAAFVLIISLCIHFFL